MKITDYLGSFPSELAKKESRSIHRMVRTACKMGFGALIWYYTWPVGVIILAIIGGRNMNSGLLMPLGMAGWFALIYALLSVLLWWGEKHLLPKRGYRF
jgi:hypothetical protein